MDWWKVAINSVLTFLIVTGTSVIEKMSTADITKESVIGAVIIGAVAAARGAQVYTQPPPKKS